MFGFAFLQTLLIAIRSIKIIFFIISLSISISTICLVLNEDSLIYSQKKKKKWDPYIKCYERNIFLT